MYARLQLNFLFHYVNFTSTFFYCVAMVICSSNFKELVKWWIFNNFKVPVYVTSQFLQSYLVHLFMYIQMKLEVSATIRNCNFFPTAYIVAWLKCAKKHNKFQNNSFSNMKCLWTKSFMCNQRNVSKTKSVKNQKQKYVSQYLGQYKHTFWYRQMRSVVFDWCDCGRDLILLPETISNLFVYVQSHRNVNCKKGKVYAK